MTQVIADKEKKSSSYREGRLDALSEEKVTKIKKFAKEYITKVIRKIEKSGKRVKLAEDTPSTSMHTPNSQDDDGRETQMQENNMTMSVEEAMDMDADSGSEDSEADEDVALDSIDPSDPKTDPQFQSRPSGATDDAMDTDDLPVVIPPLLDTHFLPLTDA